MFNPLDLTYLKHQLPSPEAVMALLAFEQEGDLVRAAKLLQTSQPALSFHLKKLDSHGKSLCSRTSKDGALLPPWQ